MTSYTKGTFSSKIISQSKIADLISYDYAADKKTNKKQNLR